MLFELSLPVISSNFGPGLAFLVASGGLRLDLGVSGAYLDVAKVARE